MEEPNLPWDDENKNKSGSVIKLILLAVLVLAVAMGIGYFGTKYWPQAKQTTTPTTEPTIAETTASDSTNTTTPTPTTSATLTPSAKVTTSATPTPTPSPTPTSAIAPTATEINSFDSNLNGKIDTIKVRFSVAMDTTITSTGGLNVSDYTIIRNSWENSTILDITLKESGSYDTDATPTLTYSSTTGRLRSSAGAAVAAFTAKAQDKANPVAISATAVDANATAGIQAGDKVVIAFSEPVKTNPNISSSNINQILALNNDHNWKDGSEKIGSVSVSLDNKTITIVLSTNTSLPTVSVNDSIHIYDGEDSITDLAGNKANITGNKVQITGSF